MRLSTFHMKSVLIFILIVSVTSCFQYPEGPIFTVETRDERFEGNWYIDEVTDENGVDVTSQYEDWTLYVEVSREGNKNIAVFRSNILYSFGTYSFADYTNDLIIIYTTYEGVDLGGEVIQRFFEVRKLTDKWLYWVDDQGNEFHWRKY